MKQIHLLLAFLIYLNQQAFSQCTINSSEGYTVQIALTPTRLVVPIPCLGGYNYNVNIDYTISFSGTNIPESLLTLQGVLRCGNTSLSFDLPNSAATGTTTTLAAITTSTNCLTDTPASLNCSVISIEINGAGIPSQIINCALKVIPVKLLYFEAMQPDNEQVYLSWQTAVEINNDFFTVESSTNGLQWLELAKVKGAGNSIEVLNYNFIDKNPRSAISYYRLKQTDFDGRFAYSKIIAVDIDGFEKPQVNVFPNPTTNQVTVEADEAELVHLRVYNLLGQDITASTKKLSSNNIKQVLDLSLLQTGIYLIKTKTTASKVYKQ